MSTGINVTKPIKILDEGIQLTADVSQIDFTGTGVTATASGNNVTVNIAGASGIWGIANTSGVYTYYTTLTLAMAAATSGQTIELFADVTETGAITITLKNGVNINGNGHTYTSSSNSNHIIFRDNNVAVNANINNLVVRKTGTVTTDNTNLSLNIQNSASKINCDGSYFYSTSKVGTISGKLTGGYYYGVGLTFAESGIFQITSTGYVSNIECEMPQVTATDPQYVYGITNAGVIQNANITTHSSIGLANSNIAKNINVVSTNNLNTANYASINNSGYLLSCTVNANNLGIANTGTIENCSAYSSGGYAIFGSGNIFNSTGVSSANIGIYTTAFAKINNCVGYSASSTGLNPGNAEASNSTGESAASYGITGFTTEIIRNCTSLSNAGVAAAFGVLWANCTFESRWNNAGGHAFDAQYGDCTLVNCTFRVRNSSANCIFNGASKTIKYSNNVFIGATTPVRNTITQGITNTQDNQGNILI